MLQNCPPEVALNIASNLELSDFVKLLILSKKCNKLYNSEEIWNWYLESSPLGFSFTSIQSLSHLFDIPNPFHLSNSIGLPAQQLFQKHFHRLSLSLEMNCDDGAHHLIKVKQCLEEFSKSHRHQDLLQSAIVLVDWLFLFPCQPCPYFYAGVVCHLANDFEHAHEILGFFLVLEEESPEREMGKAILSEIEMYLEQYSGGKDASSLIEHGQLTLALKNCLAEVFCSFDSDKDSFWNHQELSEFIFKLNQIRPTSSFLQNMILQFTENSQGGKFMDLEGFLLFYLHQTLDDPEETRSDLRKLGFNPTKLESQSSQLPILLAAMSFENKTRNFPHS